MEKQIVKVCVKHGPTLHILENRSKYRTYYRCKLCRSARVSEQRRKNKRKAIEYKGGACCKCGYNRCVAALEFHHLEPRSKDFGIGDRGFSRSWESIKVELDKCIMVCSNCHAEIESGMLDV